jgi:hypothetical protein
MRLVLAVLASVIATPALADAVTYAGTLDGRKILVELVEAVDGPVGGRYAFFDTGGDIPLDPAASPEGMIYLAEEAPCGETDCVPDDNNVVDMPPRAATWGLTIGEGGKTLVGTRVLEGKKSKTVNVELFEIGRRALGTDEPTPFGLHDRSAILGFDWSQPFTSETAPYEWALMAIEYEVGPVETTPDGSEYFYATDPRTKFAFPRVGVLSNGGDTTAINARLAEFQERLSLSALDCLAFRYAAWGQSNNMYGYGGHLAEIDQENIAVSALTIDLISWVQAGSTYCMGAHPYNHYNVYNYDIRSGERIDEADIFAAWVARDYGSMDQVDAETAAANPDSYSWGPDQELIDYVKAHTDTAELYDDQPELIEACTSDEAIADNLTFRVLPDDRIMFVLSGFPHVASVCNGDLFAVPALDISGFMHASSENYFPSLAD